MKMYRSVLEKYTKLTTDLPYVFPYVGVRRQTHDHVAAASDDGQCLVGLVFSVSASATARRGFASRSGHTKDHHKNGTNCLPALHTCVRVGV